MKYHNILLVIFFTSINLFASEIIKSESDPRLYKQIALDNGLKVLLISDLDAKYSAAALSVDVGFAQDPKGREGMAHFLEHMLFLGTKKYPKSGEYAEYISKHGGSQNAFTSDRITQYHFYVLPEYLPDTLDRFSQFFISPLFTENLVDKERHAVNSEYKMRLQVDGVRMNSVARKTSNPNHPYSRFEVGSLETLSGSKEQLRQEVVDFYSRNYSAHKMTLTIIGKESLAQLEAYAKKYFSQIKQFHVDQVNHPELFTEKQKAVRINMKSLQDVKNLMIQFPIPAQVKNYPHQSVKYLSMMMSRTDKGSLYELLRQKGWAKSVGGYNEDITDKEGVFTVDIDLTNNGLEHIDAITQATLDYMDWIRKKGISQTQFDRYKISGQIKFNNEETPGELEVASYTSRTMQYINPRDILHRSYFTTLSKYDPTQIEQLMAYFVPDNMRITFVDQNAKTNLIEANYNVPYSVRKISQSKRDNWAINRYSKYFKMPVKNPFLVVPQKDHAQPKSKYPEIVYDQKNIKIWSKVSSNYPSSRIAIQIIFTNTEKSTAKHATALSMYRALLSEQLMSLSSDFKQAGVDCYVAQFDKGIILGLSLSPGQETMVLRAVFDRIKKWPNNDKFEIVKQRLADAWGSFDQESPTNRAYTKLETLIHSSFYLPKEMIKQLNKFTCRSLKHKMENWKRSIDVLVMGDISDSRQDKLNTQLVGMLKRFPTGPAVNPSPWLNYGLGTHDHQIKKAKQDNIVVSEFFVKGSSNKDYARALLVHKMIKSDFFESLRTQQQLGYVVYTSFDSYLDNSAILLLVQSPGKDAKYIKERMAIFLTKQKKVIETISEKEFLQHKNAIKKILLQKPATLGEEFQIFSSKIQERSFRFRKREEIAKALDTITLKEVIESYNTLFFADKSNIVIESSIIE